MRSGTSTPLSAALELALMAGRREVGRGKVADYIPELGKADGNTLGVVAVTTHGERAASGDTELSFTLQSIGKVLALTTALTILGPESVFRRVGMEPTDDPFNSIANLETADSSKPLNPLINSGAIAVCGLLVEELGDVQAFAEIQRMTNSMAGHRPVSLNQRVYDSEKSSADRNRAFAYLLKDLDIIHCDPHRALDLYLQVCSLEVTCEGLAHLGLFYAASGPHQPASPGKSDILRIVNGILITCGMYNGSGEFAIRVGFPAKSGVSGAIMAVVPGKMGIGVVGPALDTKGNSIGGVRLLEELSRQLHLSLF